MGMNRSEIVALLRSDEQHSEKLFELSGAIRQQHIGNVVHLRGLIELSNVCAKDCLYCGIRKGAEGVDRYNLTDEQVIQAAKYAYENRYGSIAIQSGELTTASNANRIEDLLHQIKSISNGELGVTLSLGEQPFEVYQRWREAGADRYLLRIETSNKDLYRAIHPSDNLHSFDRRIEALHNLKECGYQLGTGVMIGLYGQTIDMLADDLLFFKEMDIDMCGMGAYLENKYSLLQASEYTLQQRFDLTLKMVATLRLMMPNINIAATTSLQAIDPLGREKALRVGANVIMPNITPTSVRKNYKLYDNKPISEDCLDIQDRSLFERINDAGFEIGFSQQGNSKHYGDKQTKKNK